MLGPVPGQAREPACAADSRSPQPVLASKRKTLGVWGQSPQWSTGLTGVPYGKIYGADPFATNNGHASEGCGRGWSKSQRRGIIPAPEQVSSEPKYRVRGFHPGASGHSPRATQSGFPERQPPLGSLLRLFL